MADNAESTSTTTEPTAAPSAETQGDPADLGDGGKKALQAERAARAAAEKAHADLAAKLKAIEDRDLSELDRAKRDAEEARAEIAKARSEALRFRVAASHGISDEDADIFLTGSDEESIKRQAERLVALRATAAPAGTPRPDLSQGATTPHALNSDSLERALRSKLGIT